MRVLSGLIRLIALIVLTIAFMDAVVLIFPSFWGLVIMIIAVPAWFFLIAYLRGD